MQNEEKFRSDISAGTEVKKKDEGGTRCYQSAGEAHRTTMVEDWIWKARDGDVWRFRGWRLRDAMWLNGSSWEGGGEGMCEKLQPIALHGPWAR